VQTADKIIEDILRSRGFKTAEARAAFLSPDYKADLHDPLLLTDMKKAVQRIVEAKQQNQKIGIFGDYDIDGITATTVLNDAFAAFGIETVHHIPNRFIEGYGMSLEGIDSLQEAGAELIVTVDCGSTSHDEIAYANKKKIDVIVTDHHEVPAKLPPAYALVNPKRLDSKYPFDSLAGVGVAFKLVQALQSKLEGLEKGQEKWLLDAVAFGTVCDIVPLLDENRSLVHWGLKVASQSRRVGFKALAEVTEMSLDDVSASTFGFVFGPRLNAAGRLETAQHSLDLMLAKDTGAARVYAQNLDQLNYQRRSRQKQIFIEAKAQAETMFEDSVLVVSGKGWAEGVVGIVASKLVEEFKKPAFVIAEIDDSKAKGSARSFGDFSVVEAIRANDKLLITGGGHKHAGGVSLEVSAIGDFRTGVNYFYKSLKLPSQQKYLAVAPDVILEELGEATVELIDGLDRLAPFGMANPEPLFEVKATVQSMRMVGGDAQHLKLQLTDGKNSLDGIGFNMPEPGVDVGDKVVAIGVLQKNQFRGNVTVQVLIREINKV